MTPEIEQTMQALRQFMLRVYKNRSPRARNPRPPHPAGVYTYYIAHPEALPQDFQPQLTF